MNNNHYFEECCPFITETLQTLGMLNYSIYRPADLGDRNLTGYFNKLIFDICCNISADVKRTESDRLQVFWLAQMWPTLVDAMAALRENDENNLATLVGKLEEMKPAAIEKIDFSDNGIISTVFSHPDIIGHMERVKFFDELERIRESCPENVQAPFDYMNQKLNGK